MTEICKQRLNISRFAQFWRRPRFGLFFAVSGILFCSSCRENSPDESLRKSGEDQTSTDHDWPLFRFDAKMQGAVPETIQPPLSLAWTFETALEGEGRPAPLEASPVIANGIIYLGTQDGLFLAIDLADGSLVWSVELDAPITAPAAVDDTAVYVGDNFGFIHAFDRSSGEPIWQFETEGKIEGGINLLETPYGLRLFVGSHDFFLYCLDATTGEEIWRYETDNYVVATPTVMGEEGSESVCFGGCDKLLHLVPIDGESEKREVDIGAFVANTSAVADGICYVAHNEGAIVAIDVASGETVWTTLNDGEHTASPAVDATTLYVASSNKKLLALDRVTGEPRWTFLAPRSLDSSPVVTGDILWQAAMNGLFYALSVESGEEIWSYDVGARLQASPAVSRGTVVIGGGDGVVYAFKSDASNS
ncbi:MAG: PQQ-binding-like beta-propeller repeat protein [Verrucomicrobiota bacterium]